MAASELMIDGADELYAVWDGKPARAYGGTADVVAYARKHGKPVRVIWPDGDSATSSSPSTPQPAAKVRPRAVNRLAVCGGARTGQGWRYLRSG